jgi:cold shock CspA family protein
MSRSQESFNKKEVRNKKEKKRQEKEKKKLSRRDNEKSSNFDDMIAYVDENGRLTSTPPDPSRKKNINPEHIEISTPKREIAETSNIRKGIVTFFNGSKGFGFIRDSETRESVFVHFKNLEEEIKEGNVVTFEAEKGQKGPAAVRVKVFRQVE